jgi:hypothetical protein
LLRRASGDEAREEVRMSVSSDLLLPLRRLAPALLVALAGCRTAAPPAPQEAVPAAPESVTAEDPAAPTVVEETRQAEEKLETVVIETDPPESR